MNKENNLPVADLSGNQLDKLKSLEEDLRKDTADNIILIAYDQKG